MALAAVYVERKQAPSDNEQNLRPRQTLQKIPRRLRALHARDVTGTYVHSQSGPASESLRLSADASFAISWKLPPDMGPDLFKAVRIRCKGMGNGRGREATAPRLGEMRNVGATRLHECKNAPMARWEIRRPHTGRTER